MAGRCTRRSSSRYGCGGSCDRALLDHPHPPPPPTVLAASAISSDAFRPLSGVTAATRATVSAARAERDDHVTTPDAPVGLDVRVLATHLGLRARERSVQIERIRAEAERWGDGAGLILGDFNEWRRRGVTARRLCPPFRSAAALPSFGAISTSPEK